MGVQLMLVFLCRRGKFKRETQFQASRPHRGAAFAEALLCVVKSTAQITTSITRIFTVPNLYRLVLLFFISSLFVQS